MSTTLKFPSDVKLALQDFQVEERKGEQVSRWKRSPTIVALKPSKPNGPPDHFSEAVVYGRRRILIDGSKVVAFALSNPSGLNTLRVRAERATRDKDGKALAGKWEATADGFVPPGASLNVCVGGGQRAIVEEMPS
jgi:hypothetical protein